jgi:hypothetical protein
VPKPLLIRSHRDANSDLHFSRSSACLLREYQTAIDKVTKPAMAKSGAKQLVIVANTIAQSVPVVLWKIPPGLSRQSIAVAAIATTSATITAMSVVTTK